MEPVPQTRDMCVQFLVWSGSKNNFCAGAERVHERILNGKICGSHYRRGEIRFSQKKKKIFYWSTKRISILISQTHGVRLPVQTVRASYWFFLSLDLHYGLSVGTIPRNADIFAIAHRGRGSKDGLRRQDCFCDRWKLCFNLTLFYFTFTKNKRMFISKLLWNIMKVY